MQNWNLLSGADASPLLTYGDFTLSRRDFIDRCEDVFAKVSRIPELGSRTPVLIADQNPLHFYSLLFALWRNRNCVVFPTRDILAGSAAFPVYKHALAMDGDAVFVAGNPEHRAIDIPEPGDTVCFSSGSTGTPKGIVHPQHHFVRNAQGVVSRIAERGYTSVTFLKPYLVSAVSHFLVHLLSGSHLVFLDMDDVSALARRYAEDPQTAFVGSPMHIHLFGASIPNGASPRFFMSSGDFIYTTYIQKLLQRFPGAVYYNAYGLAELAGRFFINRIESGTGTDDYQHLGANLAGTGYEVTDGELVVSSDFLFLGYIRDGVFMPRDGAFHTGDLIRSEGRRIFLSGRKNDEIKIGGNKVSLRHIEREVSRLFPDSLCIVIDYQHPRLGTLLALFLQNNSLSRSDIIGMLRGRLEPHELPQSYFTLDQIPYTQSLKIDRNALRNALGSLKPIL